MPTRHTLGPTSDIPENDCRTYDLDANDVTVYNIGGRFYAVSSRCPHAGTDLSRGTLSDGVVTCPGHGLRFNVATGACLDRDDFSLTRLAIELDNGILYVTF